MEWNGAQLESLGVRLIMSINNENFERGETTGSDPLA
jgi:hypothetical protein